MINKILIGLIIAIFGAGLIGLIIFVMFLGGQRGQTGQDQNNTPTNTLPGSNPTTVGTNDGTGSNTTNSPQDGATISIGTSDGGSIQVANPKKDPTLKEDSTNPGYYYFKASGNTASTTGSYVIEYIDKTQFFNVILEEEPIGQAREQAQAYLAQHLGISQSQLCSLNYMVTVPYSVNQDFASTDLRFSVCADATPL